MEEGIEEHYHSQVEFNSSTGLGVSVNCSDIDGALKFINDLLSPEIQTLRFWGIKDEDYFVDENGMFYLTDDQRNNRIDNDFLINHVCEYTYFPYHQGMNFDGINAFTPAYQPSEFYKDLSYDMKACFDAYGVQTYVEMLNKAEENPPWFPMWSYSNAFTTDTDYGKTKAALEEVKFQHLPVVVMSENFEEAWEEYLEEYNKCNPHILFDELTKEIKKRSGITD